MTPLADYSPAKRRATVATALEPVLLALVAPTGTYEVAVLVALGLDRDGIAASTAEVGRTLVKLAPAIPQAVQSAAEFKRFGRPMRHWVWSPKF